ncbi:MAG: hypothetical protein DBX52_07795 [Clostridiales bacterium]|nr:MAG: hypothetical protein DBX52_07795 [Clostridiales bacterium]
MGANAVPWKIGLSTCGGKDLSKRGFEQYRDNGIEAMELSMNYREYQNVDFGMLKRNAAETGVTLWSIHLPFQPFQTNDPSALEESIRQATADAQKKLLEKAAVAGFKIAVIHPSGEPHQEEERPARIGQAQKTLADLASFSAGIGMTLAVENLPRTCLGRNAKEMKKLLEADERLRLCFDTNHLLGESLEDFLKQCAAQVITVHVSDYDFLNERHWMPGEGRINWNAVISLLHDAGYAGPWLYEVDLKAPSTIVRSRELTYKDFKENAEALFAGLSPAALGEPKKDLKSWRE